MFEDINKILEEKKDAALCIIINTSGSTPRKTGTKMIVFADGSIKGTIGGGELEQKVIKDAITVLSDRRARTFSYLLHKDLDMGCGGSADIYIEPLISKKDLFIFGAGHIGKTLAEFALKLGFNITVIDERDGIYEQWDKKSFNLINDNYKKAFEKLNFSKDSFIACLSHLHDYDRDIIAYCAKKPHSYIGMIGSKRKIEKLKDYYLDKQLLTEEELASVNMPIGIGINCQTPEEIAISILAKIIDIRGQVT